MWAVGLTMLNAEDLLKLAQRSPINTNNSTNNPVSQDFPLTCANSIKSDLTIIFFNIHVKTIMKKEQ
jgi:hypothetical protein